MKQLVDVGTKIDSMIGRLSIIDEKIAKETALHEQENKRYERKMQELKQEKDALEIKIVVARELLIDDTFPVEQRVRTAPINLPAAMDNIVDAEPDRDFTSAEITEILLKNGFESKSGNFPLLVAINLSKRAKKGKIGSTKKGRSVTYHSLSRKVDLSKKAFGLLE